MAPTIHGGEGVNEWVLVRYDGADGLERFNLAVAYRGEGPPIVKRVVGLPGEQVQLLGGDLFVDGERLRLEAPRPHLTPLFDSNQHALFDEFDYDANVWSKSEGGWTLDSRDIKPSAEGDQLLWKSGFDDGYLGHDGLRVIGDRTVSDGGVDVEFELLEVSGTLRIQLREAGDCFRAFIDWNRAIQTDGRICGLARIERHRITAVIGEQSQSTRLVEPELMSELPFEIDRDGLHTVHFSNVDNGVLLLIDGEVALTAPYEENRALEGVSIAPGRTIGSSVTLTAEDSHLFLKSLIVSRDMSWTPSGGYGVDRPITLGPGEYFLLGDNSTQSLDGRTWGATPASELLGRPVKVIWPMERQRSLIDDLWLRAAKLR